VLYVAAADPAAPGLLGRVQRFLAQREAAEGAPLDYVWLPAACRCGADDALGRLLALVAATHLLVVPGDGQPMGALTSPRGKLELAAATLGGAAPFCLVGKDRPAAKGGEQFLPLHFYRKGGGSSGSFEPELRLMTGGLLDLWAKVEAGAAVAAAAPDSEAAAAQRRLADLWTSLHEGTYTAEDLAAAPDLAEALSRMQEEAGAPGGGDGAAAAATAALEAHKLLGVLLLIYLDLVRPSGKLWVFEH